MQVHHWRNDLRRLFGQLLQDSGQSRVGRATRVKARHPLFATQQLGWNSSVDRVDPASLPSQKFTGEPVRARGNFLRRLLSKSRLVE